MGLEHDDRACANGLGGLRLTASLGGAYFEGASALVAANV
jgi:hypothetical protein